MGVDHRVVIDVHNPAALENAFRCRVSHITARDLLDGHLQPLLQGEPVTVISLDIGGIKRAGHFLMALMALAGTEMATVFMEKYRSEGKVSSGRMVGDVKGRTVLVLDDLIAAGTTMRRAAEAFREAGARSVYGVFSEQASQQLVTPAIDRVITTNSVLSSVQQALGGRPSRRCWPP